MLDSPPKAAKSRPKRKGRQVAALPFRHALGGGLEVLIMTSRSTGRVVIPKGWPMKKLHDAKAAAREAYEEAGIVGKVRRKAIGSYPYWKRLIDSFQYVKVDVFPLEVEGQLEDWPEKGDRRLVWIKPEDAALLLDEPALADLVRRFASKKKPKRRSKEMAA